VLVPAPSAAEQVLPLETVLLVLFRLALLLFFGLSLLLLFPLGRFVLLLLRGGQRCPRATVLG